MVQKIKEQDGYMSLYFGELPADIGEIAFSNCLAHQDNQILFCKWRDNDIWTLPGGRAERGEQLKKLHTENFWKRSVISRRNVSTLKK